MNFLYEGIQHTHTQGSCMRAISESSTIKLHVLHFLHRALKWHNTEMHIFIDLMTYRNCAINTYTDSNFTITDTQTHAQKWIYLFSI